jgi:hypothetical protein
MAAPAHEQKQQQRDNVQQTCARLQALQNSPEGESTTLLLTSKLHGQLAGLRPRQSLQILSNVTALLAAEYQRGSTRPASEDDIVRYATSMDYEASSALRHRIEVEGLRILKGVTSRPTCPRLLVEADSGAASDR